MPSTALDAGNTATKNTNKIPKLVKHTLVGRDVYNIHIHKLFQYLLLSNKWLQNLVA